jgi:AAA family ATP:ADP antiporter
MMIATALCAALGIAIFSRLLSRFGPARITPPLYLVSSLLSVGQWIGIGLSPQIVTIVLYLHISVLDSLLISGFFSIINERYDPYSAKKEFSRMAIFTALGGLLGAGAASVIAKTFNISAVVIMLAVLHFLSGISLYPVTTGHTGTRGRSDSHRSLLTIVKKNTLIQNMALLMLTLSAVIVLLDYLFKATLQTTLAKPDLITFFAYFYIAIDICTLLLHTFLGSRALRWFGLGGTIIVLPLSIFLGGLITFAIRSLMSVTLLRGAASLLTNTFFGPGFELLFTPIPAADKRAGKILIDVGAHRSGSMLGSLLIMGLLMVPGPTNSYILVTVLALAGAMALLTYLLNRGYISQLAQNLSDGTLNSDQIDIRDTTTERTVRSTRTQLERDSAVQQAPLDDDGGDWSVMQTVSDSMPAAGLPTIPEPSDDDPEVESIQALRSGDENRIRRVLVSKTVTPALLPHIIPLLRNRKTLKDALTAMRPLATKAAGQLADVLLDQHQHPVIRRRIPLLLGQADNELAVQGLTQGLEDRALDVRFRCAAALAQIRTNHPHLSIDAEAVWRAVYKDLAFFSNTGFKPTQGVDPLRYLFILFGIIFSPKVMDVCYDALQGNDPTARGTALEYLENQLPQNVRTPLWPLIASGRVETGSDRSLQEITRDLLQSGNAVKDREQILESLMREHKDTS